MNGPEMVQAQYLVKFLQHTIQAAGNVIAPVPDMAGVQADVELRALHRIQDHPQLLKPAADFRSFARHGLQQDTSRGLCGQGPLQSRRNLADSLLQPLAHMTARVEIVQASGQQGGPLQILRQDLGGKGPGLRVPGA